MIEVQQGAEVDALGAMAGVVAGLRRIHDNLGWVDRRRFDRDLSRDTGWSVRTWTEAAQAGRWDAGRLERLGRHLARARVEAEVAQDVDLAAELGAFGVLVARGVSVLRELKAHRRTAVWGSGRKW